MSEQPKRPIANFSKIIAKDSEIGILQFGHSEVNIGDAHFERVNRVLVQMQNPSDDVYIEALKIFNDTSPEKVRSLLNDLSQEDLTESNVSRLIGKHDLTTTANLTTITQFLISNWSLLLSSFQ
ncbi:hypothetical protein [Acinetobacter indicus]|uniref:hypothetical protein n=1 Tax=Acinetobacter indicus TaxID=756892 RepID=UPI0013156612|nr:hypothetical protein [Acinetobacter indicus]